MIIGKADYSDASRFPAKTGITAHSVKIAPAERLAKELHGWQSNRPCGLTHDNILMRLLPGAPGEAVSKGCEGAISGSR